MSLTILGMIVPCLLADLPQPKPVLCQPAYCRDHVVRGPLRPYVPQPGDIFLATDQAVWSRLGHFAVGGAGVHHSGIVFALPDGRPALVEAGPFNTTRIEILDPYEHMATHMARGDRVWIRQRRVPLTPDQSARLTAFICAQAGKRFATWRMLGQVTPLRARGLLRTPFVGRPRGPDRISYYCSELVTESCVAAGLMDGETARPPATYPRDLFYGRSYNLYINRHLDLEPGWLPPARWLPAAPSVLLVSPQSPIP